MPCDERGGAPAVHTDLPAKADDPPVPDEKHVRDAPRLGVQVARAAGLVALAFVGMLAVGMFPADLRRGSMTPHAIEQLLNRARL